MNHMKTYSIAVLAIALMLGVSSCKPEPEGELGQPFDKVAGMIGTWELASFTQQDLNNPIQETRDLSYLYQEGASSPFQLLFNTDGTYAVDISQGKNYFGEGGDWTFDDLDVPSILILDTGSETLNFDLASVVRTFDQSMQIEIRKGCSDVETVIYAFSFNRVSQ